jgi:hypothetical protein
MSKEKFTDLKGVGHEIRIALKWFGLIGIGYERPADIHNFF